ncbi:MAG: molybdopterin-dependent oxidoreductase, partial [Betaproteobacteria bacterium]|nr:molybdopterin-dependent oxidoreductase [Betaproteobacteria bacterium]
MIRNFPRKNAIDGDAVVKEALRRVELPSRRLFLRRSLTLGGLSLLTGCAIVDDDSVENALMKVSRFNDKVQAWLFDPKQLAPTYPESMITRPFPFNAYYSEDKIPQVDVESFRLEVTGMVADKHAWTLGELRALPQTDQVTRHICVEGWSAIG